MIELSIQDTIRNYFIVMKEHKMCVSFLFPSVLPINSIKATGFLLRDHTSFNSQASLIAGYMLKYLSCNKISQRPLYQGYFHYYLLVCRSVCEQFFWAPILSILFIYYI